MLLMTTRELSSRECSSSWQCEKEAQNARLARSRESRLLGVARGYSKRQRQSRAQSWLAVFSSGSTKSCRCNATYSNGAILPSNPEANAHALCSVYGGTAVTVCTEFVAETLLPTTSGKFRLRGYRHTIHFEDGSVRISEPSVIMTGTPEGSEDVVVRVHDACFTSEVLGSLKCDCADQLQLAMDYIQEHPGGLVIYLQQEGRGIGLANKIAAYALQEKGFDTVDANRELGLPDDAREYTSVQNILAELDIKSIKLMTNNPRKIEVLESLGVKVTKRIPCIVTAQKHNLGYLNAKQTRMRHMLSQEPVLDGAYCIWNHEGEVLSSPRKGPLSDLIDERELRTERRPELKEVERSIDGDSIEGQ